MVCCESKCSQCFGLKKQGIASWKGLAKQPPPRNSSGYKNISRRLRVAWYKVLERRGQAEEASEAEDLGIRVIIGERSCATAPRWNLGSWKHLDFSSVRFFQVAIHTLGEQRTHLLECMYQYEVTFILHY